MPGGTYYVLKSVEEESRLLLTEMEYFYFKK